MSSHEAIIALLAGLGAGLASVPHCAAMCGPLAGFACVRAPGRFGALRYQAGRTLAYGAVGAGVGAAGGVVLRSLGGAVAAALVSWVLAIALGVAAYRLWRGSDAPIGAAGPSLAAPVPIGTSPRGPTLTERLMRIVPRDPLLFGAATALLPCGALYGALLLAAGTASAVSGALLMVGFATVSGLGLASIAWLSRRLRDRVSSTAVRLVAVALAVAAVFLAVRPLPTLAEPEEATPACCAAGE